MNLVDESNKVDNIKQEVVEEIKKYKEMIESLGTNNNGC